MPPISRDTGRFEVRRTDYKSWISPICTVLLIVASALGFMHKYGTSIHDNVQRSTDNKVCLERVNTNLSSLNVRVVELSTVQQEMKRSNDRVEGKIDRLVEYMVRGNMRRTNEGAPPSR